MSKTFFENPASPLVMQNWSLSNFHISRQIHQGFASHVYKAYSGNICVALKIYRLNKLSSIHRFQMFREIKIHSVLDHPNILDIFCIFQEGNNVVFVEEFMQNGDLYHILFKKNYIMSKEFIVQTILKPVILSLQYLHSNNIIHRDIKLENILVDKEWNVKLCDLGLSINASEELPVTRVGTLEYLAPEVSKCPLKNTQEENKNNAKFSYDKKVDIYSFGIMMFELMTKTTPGVPINFPDDMDHDIKDLISSMTSYSPIKRPDIVDVLKNPLFKHNM